MPDTQYRAFFGDSDRTFHLTGKWIAELERTVGIGIGAIFNRLTAGMFTHADIIETIRCGLIGGGSSPAEAKRLVGVYATDRPLAETLPVALGILEAAYFGTPAAAIAELSPDAPALAEEAA